MHETPTPRKTLRDLPLAARLTIATFLISVGIGYFSALVQLHFQHASSGNPMPTKEDVIRRFHGSEGQSTLEQLIVAPESEPFSSGGSMRIAFTTKSVGWETAIGDKAGEIDMLPEAEQQKKRLEAEVALRKERETEAKVLVHWIRSGLDKKSYEDDAYPMPKEYKDSPLLEKYLKKDKDKDHVKIRLILRNRCVRCHKEGGSAADAPLDTFEHVKVYADLKSHTAMPIRKLAQSTHVHLLGFSMLYGITGLLFALTGLPGFLRGVIGPLALLAQVVDISFWWLARLEGDTGAFIATLIPISGGIVAVALAVQILCTLFSMFGKYGRMVLVLLMLATGAAGYVVADKVMLPMLEREKTTGTMVE